jgi:hypothetical protein
VLVSPYIDLRKDDVFVFPYIDLMKELFFGERLESAVGLGERNEGCSVCHCLNDRNNEFDWER